MSLFISLGGVRNKKNCIQTGGYGNGAGYYSFSANGGLKTCRTLKDGENFKDALYEAYQSQSDKDRWRVDLTHEPKDYIGMKIYVGKDGVCAVHDGDIISVCTNRNTASKGAGTRLIERAVKAGGYKLDSYDGNIKFYERNNFEAVSYTRVDKRFVPDGFRTSKGNQENVIFFRYNPNGRKYGDSESFYNHVTASRSYGKAEKVRNRRIESSSRRNKWNS